MRDAYYRPGAAAPVDESDLSAAGFVRSSELTALREAYERLSESAQSVLHFLEGLPARQYTIRDQWHRANFDSSVSELKRLATEPLAESAGEKKDPSPSTGTSSEVTLDGYEEARDFVLRDIQDSEPGNREQGEPATAGAYSDSAPSQARSEVAPVSEQPSVANAVAPERGEPGKSLTSSPVREDKEGDAFAGGGVEGRSEPIVDGFLSELGCTVRDCRGCGCLVAGGPTICMRCAREEDERCGAVDPDSGSTCERSKAHQSPRHCDSNGHTWPEICGHLDEFTNLRCQETARHAGPHMHRSAAQDSSDGDKAGCWQSPGDGAGTSAPDGGEFATESIRCFGQCEFCGRAKLNRQQDCCANIHICRDLVLRRAQAAEARAAEQLQHLSDLSFQLGKAQGEAEGHRLQRESAEALNAELRTKLDILTNQNRLLYDEMQSERERRTVAQETILRLNANHARLTDELRAELDDSTKRRAAEGHVWRRRIANQRTELRNLGKAYQKQGAKLAETERVRDTAKATALEWIAKASDFEYLLRGDAEPQIAALRVQLKAREAELAGVADAWERYGHSGIDQEEFEGTIAEVALQVKLRSAKPVETVAEEAPQVQTSPFPAVAQEAAKLPDWKGPAMGPAKPADSPLTQSDLQAFRAELVEAAKAAETWAHNRQPFTALRERLERGGSRG